MTAQIIDFLQKKRERDERMAEAASLELSNEELEFLSQHIQIRFVIDSKTHEILSSGEKDKE